MGRQDVFVANAKAPVPRREQTSRRAHGVERPDHYAWMRDPRWTDVLADPSRLDGSIRAHLVAENAYSEAALLAPLAELRARLLSEMTERLDPQEKSVAVRDGPYAYYHRYSEGAEHPIYARTERKHVFEETPPETILLDGNALAKDGYFSFGEVRHSPDHARIAYTIDTTGSEYHALAIRDMVSGQTIETGIADAEGGIAWGASSAYLYWVRRNALGRPDEVWRWHEDGSSECVYREDDPGFFVSLDRTARGSYVVIHCADHMTSECHLLAAGDADATPGVFAPRRNGVEYMLDEYGEGFIVRTNADGATDFKLAVRGKDGAWCDLVPHRAGCLIEDFAVFADHLVRLERENARLAIIVRDLRTEDEHRIALGAEAQDMRFDQGYEHDSDQLRLFYSSPTSPRCIADYDMGRRSLAVRKAASTHWGHRPGDYVSECLSAPAADGQSIPVTVTRHRNTPTDGSAPLLLYGYGAYGITVPDAFRSEHLSLIDRGFVYANAHIRGSKAKGHRWYQGGKLAAKTNSFSDFVAAGRYLAEAGYTSPGRIVAMGRSAGGLLVGAAVGLDPELFAGVIAGVPFVDALNTMSDADLPLTPPEWPEWGNPVASATDEALIASYCPYQNAVRRRYPPILATGSVSDPRVGYWEPAKWIARLRHEAPEAGPFFLLMNMSAGHGGESGRYRRLRETATEYAFALAVTGKVRAAP